MKTAAAFALVIGLALPACSRSAAARPADAPDPDRAARVGWIPNGDVRLGFRYQPPLDVPTPFPAVVIGHGSGEVTRHACEPLADNFRRRGYATLCYDKRGVGESSGIYERVGPFNSHEVIPELASDMAAAVAFLRDRPEVEKTRVGLVGGSQAGWVVPLAAVRSRANFIVLLVAPAVTVGQEIHYSKFAEGTSLPFAALSRVVRDYRGPTGFDPLPDLQELEIPGLWLLAGADRSIPTVETVALLDRLIAKGKRYTRKVYPGAAHSLQHINIWPDVDDWLGRALR